ncbi:MAG TPA: hypothetical protein VFF11_02050, partial [Candidatus Binatia bacterium]|nr:hypothetical protein [Candidatus Binatia bacterium]
MPGIFGIIGGSSPGERRPLVERMIKSAWHEPFYSSGLLADDQMNIACGWVCHRGSFSDCLPLWNETKDVCLIFAGQDFTDQSEVRALRARPHGFAEGNGSYLVHLYEEQGPKFIQTLNGWFSGVLLDLREEKVMLFNDRFGLSRLYFHESSDGLLFASEAKSLLAVNSTLRKLDLRSVAERVACGCVLQNRTLFSGISLLPSASCWTFSRRQPPVRQVYFRPEVWENQTPLRP